MWGFFVTNRDFSSLRLFSLNPFLLKFHHLEVNFCFCNILFEEFKLLRHLWANWTTRLLENTFEMWAWHLPSCPATVCVLDRVSPRKAIYAHCLNRAKTLHADSRPNLHLSPLPAAIFTRSPVSTFPNLHILIMLSFSARFPCLCLMKPTCSQEPPHRHGNPSPFPICRCVAEEGTDFWRSGLSLLSNWDKTSGT